VKLQVKLTCDPRHKCSAMMDVDDDCVMKYIEIVPLDNSNNCTDVKQEPDQVKVFVYLSLCYVVNYLFTFLQISTACCCV